MFIYCNKQINKDLIFFQNKNNNDIKFQNIFPLDSCNLKTNYDSNQTKQKEKNKIIISFLFFLY